MQFAVELPPGVVRKGTEYESRGRYFDANLWRWIAGTAGPIGGWLASSISAVSGAARAILPWSADDSSGWAAIGTHTNLYVMSRSGAVSDITPVGFTPGRTDAIVGGGYGMGPYGVGTYGTRRTMVTQVTPASVWSLDTWGEHLIGCMADDGKIYEWALDAAAPAVQVANSPAARAILATSDRILMALGAGGEPRRIAWSDRENNTVWTDTATNYAGSFNLQTAGRIIAGRQINGGSLIWTDLDLWLADFKGQPLVYGFSKRGTGCGAVSMNCMAVTDAGVFWMGKNGFFAYDGFTQPLPCDVHDYVFSDINTTQASKVFALHNSAFGEVTWRYVSLTSEQSEIDRYVTYNYRERHWTIGQLVRLCGADSGVFPYPMEVGSDGYVYDHEKGFDHDETDPYAKTGPFEIGEGERLMQVQRIVPDVSTLGAVSVSFETRDRPNTSPPVSFGPYSLTDKTDVRFTARLVEMKLTGEDGQDFRVGRFRLEGQQMGRR